MNKSFRLGVKVSIEVTQRALFIRKKKSDYEKKIIDLISNLLKVIIKKGLLRLVRDKSVFIFIWYRVPPGKQLLD